jgi:dipeptidyl aminopeptidase/acylaminoacyl peptidase
MKKELIRYKRADGVDLSAKLFLPKDYDGKTPLPLLCWAYPHEFKSKEFASQVKTSPYRFQHAHWSRPIMWVARGWAVLDDFSVPIVGGPNTEPNDTFIEQLVSSAEAAIGECIKRGVCDGSRVAVGGHSYGAFMAVHLVAHTKLFKGAIARSGAYNRSLTPFSYQNEQRTFWQVPEIYMRNSPFTHADKVSSPVLLIHGADDPNPGTHAMQTERMFAALQGLGKKVRSVVLPFERHSYDALESVLHVIAEQDMFLTKHVLNSIPNNDMPKERAKL